ncbi:MAG: hypothetical protein EBT79_02210 [Actinobacteria bacterium]|nr:hypothetical protein [Actinomycetota bacterium]NBR66088.1 hypothetical protein [Actinomycetota bacterium]
MKDIQSRAEALAAAQAAANRMFEVSCPKRQARAQAVRVDGLVITAEAVHAAVRSSDGSTAYRVRIGHSPKRTWKCSCPDAAQRGLTDGPCKHAVAVARVAASAAKDELSALAAVLVIP